MILRRLRLKVVRKLLAGNPFMLRKVSFIVCLCIEALLLSVISTAYADTAPAVQRVVIPGLDEPIIATRPLQAGENEALLVAREAFLKRKDSEDISTLTAYLDANPNSPYRMALLTDIGIHYFRIARFSKCVEAFEEAWKIGRDIRNHPSEALAHRAGGELANMYARLGRYESLKALLDDVKDRDFRGPGSTLVEAARTGFQLMTTSPGTSFRCGPLALSRILDSRGKNIFPDAIRSSASTREGMSLVQVRDLGKEVGFQNITIAQREPGAQIVVPSVVHWKVGHYAAILREERGRYFVQDPTFGTGYEAWISPETLNAEASGYFLVDTNQLPSGWKVVADDVGKTVFGKGQTNDSDPNSTGPTDKKAKSDEDDCGMPRWNVHSLLVSLNIHDTPLQYRPPVGPRVSFTLTYNSRESEAFSIPSHSNFGPKWNFNAVAFIRDLAGGQGDVSLYGGYGGWDTFKFDGNTQSYNRSKKSYAQVVAAALTDFEVSYPDGTKEYYGLRNSNGSVYRTKLTDAAGNELTFIYNQDEVAGTVRLYKIRDAIGQETVFDYANGGLQPTKITDPFGRFAAFTYDANGRLLSITDMAGMTSSFSYQSNSDFISALTTPYGTTRFTAGTVNIARYLQITHPNGDMERAEFRHDADNIPAIITNLPTNMLAGQNYNNYRNALYWDRKAMREGGGDPSKARLTHFLHTANVSVAAGTVESEKAPMEGRIWYNYVGQTDPLFVSATGDERISKIGRLLDDGTTQLYQLEYNAAGNPTKLIDPVGRTTEITYAPNMADVLSISQKTGTNSADTLATYTYNSQHRPLTSTDAAGRTTTYTYNGRGQLLTEVNAKGETNTYSYNTNFQLVSIDGPLAGTNDLVKFTWDAKGRLASITDAAALSIALEYDNLDRLTKRTYSDGQYEQWTYDKLDQKSYRTRSGHTFNYKYNELAQLIEIADDQNRKTVIDWCRCGSPTTIIDALGKMTQLNYDIQGRLTGKTYADGSSSQIVYENLTGRIAKTIDEDGREQNFTYSVDNKITGISYSGTGAGTPSVNLSWDPIYPRVTQMIDGIGTTAFNYHPVTASQNGAGLLASIDGPWANDTINFQYDELGRLTSRAINGSAEKYVLDALSRFQQITNPLGAFNYTFYGASGRLNTMTLPNGQTLQMNFSGSSSLQQLKEIIHKGPAAQAISRFGYAYDDELHITSLTNQLDNTSALVDSAQYDSSGQLTSYTQSKSGGGQNVYQFGYDVSDNRVTETINGTNTTATVNALNQISSVQPIIAAIAQYEWDGAGRLAAVTQGTKRSEFSYDGFGRRVKIVEKESNAVVSERRFIWVGFQIAEERDGANALVKRFFSQGFTSAAGTFFYTRDQLGSIREVVDSLGTIRARYSYDPFGRRTKISGDIDADFGFSGHFYHVTSKLVLTYARAYDPNLGRWISRDPSGESSGINLYAYVHNNPLRFTDALGLDISPYSPDQAGWGGQYGDMAINTGKVLAGTAAFASAVGAGALTIAAAPLLAPAALVGGLAISGVAIAWTGYSLFHASRNLTLNSMGFQNEYDGNLIKDGIGKICGDKDDPALRWKRGARDVVAGIGDLAVGKALMSWAGAAVALPAVGDAAADAASLLDLGPVIMNAASNLPAAMSATP